VIQQRIKHFKNALNIFTFVFRTVFVNGIDILIDLLRIAECIYLAIAVPPNGKMFIKISIRIISCHVPNRYC
jgi:hypothetical protein